MKMANSGNDLLLWLIIIISTIVLVLVPILGAEVDPTIGMVFIVIFGIIDLISVLSVSSKSYISTNLACKEEALGLPAGSIRALIALGLIIIFAIMAIFMYNRLTPSGLLLTIPANQTLVFANGTTLQNPSGIALMTEPSQAMRDFSTQTLTTVSTLVVALAGFYFGTKAVNSGKDNSEKDDKAKDKSEKAANKSLETNVETEEDEFKVKPPVSQQIGKPLTIKIENIPKGDTAELIAVEGDKRQAFSPTKRTVKGDIIYKPSPEHENTITAILALKSKDKIKATKELPIVLESLAVTRKGSGKTKAGTPVTFDVKTISAAGNKPHISVHGDDHAKLDTTKLEKGEFTYTPSQKSSGGRKDDKVVVDITLKAKPPIELLIPVEIEP
jgi:hypothetical protein